MKKQLPEETLLLDVQEAQMELIRRKAECKFNDGVICGLWEKTLSAAPAATGTPTRGSRRERDHAGRRVCMPVHPGGQRLPGCKE